MATHDYVIDNQSAPALRADLNSVLQAIVTQNSNATAPVTTYANMIWYDTATNQLKKRNEANSAWIILGTVDEAFGGFSPNTNVIRADTITNTAGTGSVAFTTGISVQSGVTSSLDTDAVSAGAYTPTPVGGNVKALSNSGAFTFNAPTAAGDYTLVVQITNAAGAGAITFAGFTRVVGDATTTVVGDDFLVFITKVNGFVLANVQALQ